MNKHQDFFAKTQWKGSFSSGVIRTPEKKNTSTWILLLIILILGAASTVQFFGLIPSFQTSVITDHQEKLPENPYTIGKEIQIEGLLQEDNSDLITYTHTLTNSNGDTFLLKSKTRPLNNYSTNLTWIIQIIGTIEAFYKSKPIIEVTNIGTQTTEQITQNTTGTQNQEASSPGIYIANAGIYFGQEFFDTYAFVGQAGSNNKITIKNLENEKITTISYFNCQNSGDQNCKENERVFKNSSAKEITNQDAITFYRLSEVKSRFFQNNNWRGYFINDAEDSEVESIIKLIKVSSPDRIKDFITLHGIKVCLGTDNGLNKITSHTLVKTKEGIQVNMEWNGEKIFSCQTLFDPSLPNNFKFIDLQIKNKEQNQVSIQTWTNSTPEKTKEHQEAKESAKEASEGANKQQAITHETHYNPNVAQFPINLEKTLSYRSTRGEYEMQFPSMNMAYEATATDTDLGEAGVRCKYSINVIQYKDKEQIKTNPTLTIYECGNKKKLTAPKENYLIKELWDKQFIIEIHDGAWLDFAKNITISSL